MADYMAQVLEAHRAYKQAERDALALRASARVRLGAAVERQRQAGRSLESIARELGVVTEQVRRYRQAYLEWLRDHPGESPG